MSNLIERLRDVDNCEAERSAVAVCKKAADELERLTAFVRKVAEISMGLSTHEAISEFDRLIVEARKLCGVEA